MGLDVFHQVLLRLHEACGGDLHVHVNIIDVLRRERLLGNQEMIFGRLLREGWIANAPGENRVFVTPWGVDELRKAQELDSAPAATPETVSKATGAARLARELAAALDELAAAPKVTAKLKNQVKKAQAALADAVAAALE